MATTKKPTTKRTASTAKAKVRAKATKRTKAQPKAKTPVKVRSNAKFGGQRQNKRRQVVTMRDKKQMSWKAIGSELDVAPRTVRRLYDEAKGAGAHHGLLPGKGGRAPAS